MFHRPRDLPPLHPRDMSDDGQPYIGSGLHNNLMGWLFLLLQSLERTAEARWHATNVLDMAVPWDDGRVDHFFADLTIYPASVDPNAETIDLSVAGPPLLVLEIADVAAAKDMAADQDLTAAKAALYAAIGVREYLVYDLEIARRGRGSPIWARRKGSESVRAGQGWEVWEPDERGRWVSATAGVAFSPAGAGGEVSLRLWGLPDWPYMTEGEYLDEVSRRGQEERAAVAEAKLTLLRSRYRPDMSRCRIDGRLQLDGARTPRRDVSAPYSDEDEGTDQAVTRACNRASAAAPSSLLRNTAVLRSPGRQR